MMPPPPSTSSIHSDDFDVTLLDETAPPVTPSECAKKKVYSRLCTASCFTAVQAGPHTLEGSTLGTSRKSRDLLR